MESNYVPLGWKGCHLWDTVLSFRHMDKHILKLHCVEGTAKLDKVLEDKLFKEQLMELSWWEGGSATAQQPPSNMRRAIV